MLVIIAGIGTIGTHLVASFLEKQADVIIIEQEEEKIKYIKEKFDVLVLKGSTLSHYILRSANVVNCEIFIACSSSDSMNIVACQLAKRLGASKCVARIYSEDIFPYNVAELESYLGVDWLISPSQLTGNNIVTSFFNSNYCQIESYFASRIDIAKLIVSSSCTFKHQSCDYFFTYKEIKVVSCYRNGKPINHLGTDFTFQIEDEVIIVSNRKKIIKLLPELYPKDSRYNERIYFAGISKILTSSLSFLDHNQLKNVIILDNNLEKCHKLEEDFDVTIMNIDPADHKQLAEIEPDTNSIFIASGEDDASNLTYALNALDMQFSNIKTIVNYNDKIRLFSRFNFQTLFFPSNLVDKEIFRFFNRNTQSSFDLVENFSIKAIIKEITSNSSFKDQTINNISKRFPKMKIIVAWQKGKITLCEIDEKLLLSLGDRIIIITDKSNNIELEKLLFV